MKGRNYSPCLTTLTIFQELKKLSLYVTHILLPKRIRSIKATTKLMLAAFPLKLKAISIFSIMQ